MPSQLISRLLTICLTAVFLLAGCLPSAPTSPPAASPQADPDAWDDRSVYRAGLVESEQKTLEGLPGASLYHINLEIAPDYTSLRGRERIRYTNQESVPLDALYFQLFPNMAGGRSTLSALSVDGVPVEPVYEDSDSTACVPLPSPLQPGQRTVLQLDFQVQLPTDAGGNYGLFGYLDGILVLDGFYPAIPVEDARGWHKGKLPPNSDTTFQDASFYQVRVTAPAALKLVASGVQVDKTTRAGDQVVTFVSGPARDFYLAASEQFEVVSSQAGPTTVNSYAFKAVAAGSRLALRTAVNALQDYSARFGAYPYTEFDLVSTPMRGATGIEYPGITGINRSVYDLSATVNDLPASALLEGTVAHEVGHQWFYNVVGNDQINEPWLDESLTQYVTGLYYLDQYGEQGWDSYRASWLARWERVERRAIPIGLPAAAYQGKEYGAIVYGRGPLFIDALAKKLGQAAFDEFLRNYYQANRWGIASAATFEQLAAQRCQCDLTPLFDEWVNSK